MLDIEQAKMLEGWTKVDDEVIALLQQATIEENFLRMPLTDNRNLYMRTNEVLTRIGGTWKSGKIKAHVFEADPGPYLELVLSTGLMPPKNPYSFFPTPSHVAELLLEGAMFEDFRIPNELERPIRGLEPSAGTGALVRAVESYCSRSHVSLELDCCEIVQAFHTPLEALGVHIVANDFLSYRPQFRYDFIIANPPFTGVHDKLLYIEHYKHAWFNVLAKNGVMLGVAPSGILFREDKRTKDFRLLVEHYGAMHELPHNAFKGSGTGVATVIFAMRRTI